MNLPPLYDTDSHDDSETGRQELHLALRGSGAVVVRDDRLPSCSERLPRIDAGVGQVLAACACSGVGALPGGAYVPPERTGVRTE